MTTPEPAEAPDGADRADPTFEIRPQCDATDDVSALWLSPHCVTPETHEQLDMFGGA